jgi:hypothetical protein
LPNLLLREVTSFVESPFIRKDSELDPSVSCMSNMVANGVKDSCLNTISKVNEVSKAKPSIEM